MPTILSLQEAAGRIVAAAVPGRPEPFFLVVGAGISAPSVPLAAEIVRACRAKAAKEPPPSFPTPLDEYSYWWEQAFWDPTDRQEYLRGLIEREKVTPANLRIAHLLIAPRIFRTVLTVNFDDFVRRALTLFGREHVVCDHPLTASRITADSENVQVVHIHGAYYFYDCCNLTGELAERALPGATSSSMPGLIDSFLAARSPLVVGYSGWEGDVFMSRLKRRLDGQRLPRRLYWFCYNEEAANTLPAWLKGHQDVVLVLPEPPKSAGIKEPASDHAPSGDARDAEEGVLPAVKVFEELARRLDLEPPPLATHPLGFFRDELERLVGSEWGTDDAYDFTSLIARVTSAATKESAEWQRASAAKSALRRAVDLVQTYRYDEAIKALRLVRARGLDAETAAWAAETAWAAARGVNESSGDAAAGCDIVLRIAKASPGSVGDIRIAQALNQKAVSLSRRSRLRDSLAACEDVVARFGGSDSVDLQVQVARALYNKGVNLDGLGLYEESVVADDELITRFDASHDPELQRRVAAALVSKGGSLVALKRSEDALVVFDDVISRTIESTDPALSVHAARALFDKGIALTMTERKEDGLAAYGEVVTRFGGTNTPEVQSLVARALVNKGSLFATLRRHEVAIATYEEVVSRFGESTNPELQAQVAMALVNKGFRLNALHRPVEAIEVYERCVSDFGTSTTPKIQHQVSRAKSALEKLRDDSPDKDPG